MQRCQKGVLPAITAGLSTIAPAAGGWYCRPGCLRLEISPHTRAGRAGTPPLQDPAMLRMRTVSCNSCHSVMPGGTGKRDVSCRVDIGEQEKCV